jgi:predicted nucleic acid-binding protein
MIVISDTTPLIHFGIIKRLDLLHTMYGEIFITKTVLQEAVTEGVTMGKPDAFLIEKEIGKWIKVDDPKGDVGEICRMYRIHTGEAESILLAQELSANLLLIDERDGRIAAKSAGINVIGTIGIISDCVNRHLLTIGTAVEILTYFKTDPSKFWIDPQIIDIAIRRIEERISKKGEI